MEVIFCAEKILMLCSPLGMVKWGKEGREEGRQAGKLDLLKDLIQKKLSKGKSTGAIAEELEIEEALVLELVQGMEK